MYLLKMASALPTVFLCTLLLAGCDPKGKWKTSYADVVNPAISANWNVGSINVTVPDTLTVSEENLFAPNADIVWRGEPIGNRYAQVDAIITEAARQGTSTMSGARAVRLEIEVVQFHALTEKTRFTLQQSGVHNIQFSVQVFDANSGDPITTLDHVQADLVGFSGNQAIEAVAAGQTQRVRIVDHVSRVIAGWMGHGPDIRGRFTRAGR